MEKRRDIRVKEIFILAVLFFSIVICSSVILFNLRKIKEQTQPDSVPMTERDYTVLITGIPENEVFLSQVFEGASIVSNFYDSAIQYYVPEVKAKSADFQSLLDYAGFINADCVITYLDFSQLDFKLPVNSEGKEIPLVTVGYYSAELPIVSHIGVNYAELGSAMAEEAVAFLNGEGSVYILNTSDMKDYYTSTLLNNLLNRLKTEEKISIVNTTNSSYSDFPIEDDIRQQVASSGQIDLIISLSEQGTVLAAQTVSDLNLNAKTKIIGFGEGVDSFNYYEKGIVSELFCTDAVDIGKKAMQEFFEYMTKGSANSYVTSEIQLLKQGNKNEKSIK